MQGRCCRQTEEASGAPVTLKDRYPLARMAEPTMRLLDAHALQPAAYQNRRLAAGKACETGRFCGTIPFRYGAVQE